MKKLIFRKFVLYISHIKYIYLVAMGRCQSTPGQLESIGRVPLEHMDLQTASIPLAIHSSHPPSYRDQIYR